MRIYDEQDWENGNISDYIANKKGLQFIGEHFGENHNIHISTKKEGHALITPKEDELFSDGDENDF